jgi:transcriptional regulator with XRE-family HTH domain
MGFVNERLRQWGTNVRVARLIQGMTQAQLAVEIGVKQASVSRWETGAVGPSDDDKVALARVLKQDVRMLFPLFAVAS